MRDATFAVEIQRDVKVRMADGAVLLTDVYHPAGVDRVPTILERTPYGRAAIAGFDRLGEVVAGRGYCFVLQAVRGTDGSEGEQSFFAERDDGRATADWLTTQPWWNGRLGTYGSSYMGFTQWALASTSPSYLRAMVISLSSTHSSWYLGGALALELMINWDLSALNFLHPKRGGFGMEIEPDAIARKQRMLAEAFGHLPVGDALLHVAGENHPLFEKQIAHPSGGDPHWRPLDFGGMFAERNVPTLLIDGWFDAPLPGVCDDFVALRRCGTPAALRIGAGGHLDGGGEGAADAALEWFDTYLRDESTEVPPSPVAVHVQGEGGQWREFPTWPPPTSTPTRWYLHADGRLGANLPADTDDSSTYRYDPTDPTQALGGTGLMTGGSVDNAALEDRSDVLVFTSDPLDEPLELIGDTNAHLEVSSSRDHTDFFVRLCDVHPDGRSFNVCDGLQRFDPPTIERRMDGTFPADIRMWPVGHRFEAGHSLRILVASGAHPVYNRNLGTGEPPATATELRVADQAIHHRVSRASFVTLPQAAPTE
jgi:putative CocE/NonD family hydrolase